MKTALVRRFRAILSFAISAALVAAAGCSEDTVTGPPEPAADLSGHWTGTATERSLNDESHRCHSESTVEVEIRQVAGQVHIEIPAGACSGAGIIVFEGTLAANALGGQFEKAADGESCEMRGSATGTGEAARIVLHGAFQGSCGTLSLHLELSR